MKVLVIRFSSIGDIVLTTPVLRCLKQQTGAEIHFLTKRKFEASIKENPNIDRLWTIEQSVKEVLPALKNEHFDHIVDLHHNLRSWQVRLALRRPSTAFNKLNLEKWLRVHTGINLLPNVHIVDRYLATVKKLGVVNDGAGLDFPIPPEAVVRVGEWRHGLEPSAYIAFAIGATHATKRLTDVQIADICRLAPMPVVLLGGVAEAPVGERVAAACGPKVWNACGKTSLHQSASFVAQAAVVITHDTGMMHIAAALRKRVVSVWGNTIPEFGMYPYYPEGRQAAEIVEVNGLGCRPCSKIGYEVCPQKHFRCIREISAERVVAALGN